MDVHCHLMAVKDAVVMADIEFATVAVVNVLDVAVVVAVVDVAVAVAAVGSAVAAGASCARCSAPGPADPVVEQALSVSCGRRSGSDTCSNRCVVLFFWPLCVMECMVFTFKKITVRPCARGSQWRGKFLCH